MADRSECIDVATGTLYVPYWHTTCSKVSNQIVISEIRLTTFLESANVRRMHGVKLGCRGLSCQIIKV
jgi:hypothetical protein